MPAFDPKRTLAKRAFDQQGRQNVAFSDTQPMLSLSSGTVRGEVA